jgi:uncharacterized protein (DUF58 family)
MTRYGVLALAAGFVAVGIGRTFGVIELYVIGAGFLGAVAAAAVFVAGRTPRVSGMRRVSPVALVAGDLARVDLDLTHHGIVRSTRFGLRERVARRVGDESAAELTVEPLGARSRVTASYQLPTSTRGVIELGPLVAEVRDPLGLLRRTRPVAGVDHVLVAPRTFPVHMPNLGSGPLGRHLLGQARRLGPGEFHSLREYADGDEPKTIHWRASARSDKLLVKQHTVEGIRRAMVLLDVDQDSYADAASFERAVTVAASLVRSADDADLITRFVAGGVDLRGPDVASESLGVLARIDADSTRLSTLGRHPGEGVGLLLVVSGTTAGTAMAAARELVDPTQTTVHITTDETTRGPISAAARTEAEFLSSWATLVGRGRR